MKYIKLFVDLLYIRKIRLCAYKDYKKWLDFPMYRLAYLDVLNRIITKHTYNVQKTQLWEHYKDIIYY